MVLCQGYMYRPVRCLDWTDQFTPLIMIDSARVYNRSVMSERDKLKFVELRPHMSCVSSMLQRRIISFGRTWLDSIQYCTFTVLANTHLSDC